MSLDHADLAGRLLNAHRSRLAETLAIGDDTRKELAGGRQLEVPPQPPEELGIVLDDFVD